TAPNGSAPNKYRRVCSDIHVTGGEIVNFAPGIYWMKGSSLNIEGGLVTCTACSTTNKLGVTFIFTTPNNNNLNQIGTVKINGAAPVWHNAPGDDAATNKGLLYYQTKYAPQQSNKPASRKGGATTVLKGPIYSPKNEVQWPDNTPRAPSSPLITADTVTFTGN